MSEQKEREIGLSHLLFYILLHWRMIIVWMFIGAVLLGGYSYYNSLQTMQQQATMVENQMDRKNALEELKSILTTEQLCNVNRVIQYEAFDEYYNQSILMKINPTEVSCSKILYVVNSESIEKSKNIRKVYEELITGGFLQWLKEKTTENITPGISELITVTELIEGETYVTPQGNEISSMSLISQEGTSIEIKILHSSAEECKKLSSYLKEYVEEQVIVHKDKLGNHELVYIADSFELISDTGLLKSQRNMLSNIEIAREASKDIKDAFSAIESRYYQLLTKDENTGKETAEIVIASPSISIKYVILGMFAFAFVYVFGLFVIYIMNMKIRITDDMTELFGVAHLGTITKQLEKKRLFWEVDLWICNLQNRNRRIFSEDEEIGLTISAIKIAAKKNGFIDVLCIGTAWCEKAFDIAEKVKAVLTQEGINVQLVKNVLYDQESLELLDGATGAFLLECANMTLYDEIQKELELLERQEIKCLGIVLAEV